MEDLAGVTIDNAPVDIEALIAANRREAFARVDATSSRRPDAAVRRCALP
jgi:hypothetical protein